MASLAERMLRAAKLDVNLYEEVEADPQATGQALTVVVLSGVAAGIGTFGVLGFKGLVSGTLLAVVGWFIWAYLTYIIGTRLLPEPQTEADYGQLLRTIGFSSAPGVLRAAGVIGPLFGLVTMVAAVWQLVAMVIAVRQALDYRSTWRALAVCLIGWVVQGLVMWLFLKAFGVGGAPGA